MAVTLKHFVYEYKVGCSDKLQTDFREFIITKQVTAKTYEIISH
jgi:hypothetical protein